MGTGTHIFRSTCEIPVRARKFGNIRVCKNWMDPSGTQWQEEKRGWGHEREVGLMERVECEAKQRAKTPASSGG